MKKWLGVLMLCMIGTASIAQKTSKKLPLIVLTFDDASASHYSNVAPMLKKYGFGATFYVCEFPPDFADSSKYMNWRQIAALSAMGFEIGNHTWHHKHVNNISGRLLEEELGYIERKCDSLGIPRPVTFAYPAYVTDSTKFSVLKKMGYKTARAGGDSAWNPMVDNPMLVPSFTIKGNDSAYFFRALSSARKNEVIVFTVHGVPDNAHDWVNTPPDVFRRYMEYLHRKHYKVVSMKEALRITSDRRR